MPGSSIVRLQTDDLPRLIDLLDINGLPSQDCADLPDIFHGIFDQGRLIAAGGLETAGEYSLLRSLVVDPRYRGRGLAREIADFLIARASARRSRGVYLLTESAADYFPRLGFRRVAREQVPTAVAQTRQFASLCPDTASCLLMPLPRK